MARQSLRLRVLGLCVFAGLVALSLVAQRGTVEAVEIGKTNTSLLPTGKEADGIIGDFVLRNDKVVALIGGNLPDRKANMGSEWEFPTPGSLYDLDLRGASNDQLTLFRPGQLGGMMSWVRVAKDGSDGTAVVEAVRTAAAGDELYQRHEYRLEPGWQHLLVVSTYRNESKEAQKITPPPAWKEFSQRWDAGTIHVGDSIDPFDKRAYAWTPVNGALDKEVMLNPGEERSYSVAIAVAESPLAAFGVAAALNGVTGEVSGRAAAPHGSVVVETGGAALPAYPDDNGSFRFRLPPGQFTATLKDLGRDEISKPFTVAANRTAQLEFALPPASAVTFDVRDEAGRPSPCKVQFLGRNGTATPNFGTEYRVHGNNHQYQSHDGRFTQQVAPGDYTIRITHGPEYDMVERDINVPKGQTVAVQATLRRTVLTTGWISADYHAHSTPSGDNYCNTDDRIINFAAEQLEFIPTTEHNRIYDWSSHIDRLGLSSRLKTIIGIELTGPGQHFNSFPLKRDPYVQDGGAPKWAEDPRINAVVLRDIFNGGPDRWVQINHPTVGEVFNDRNRDGVEDGGYPGFERLVDAAEVWSDQVLNTSPVLEREVRGRKVRYENRTFGWLQLLNQGRHVWCVAVSDAHRIFGNGVGDWRTYVPSSTDDPAAIDPKEIIHNSKAGQMMLTNGPFLEVATAEGAPIGSRIISAGGVTLKIKVQTPNWLDIDRVQILVNGRQAKEYNFTRDSHASWFKNGVVKFEAEVPVKLQRDAHLIVVAIGEHLTIEKGWGLNPQGAEHPVAFTNPIYVDVDGKGFQANGDNLGHPILTVIQRQQSSE